MANSEILAAIKSLQSSFESHLLVTNQMVKEFMYSFDSRFASLQHNKPPLGFPSTSSSSHPPPTELSPFTKPNCGALGGGAIIPFLFSKSRPKSPMEAFALAKAYEARLEESRSESRSGVRESIKAIPFISVQPSSLPNPFPNPSLTSHHSIHQQLGLFTHGYADQYMEFNRDGLISATAMQGPSTLHPLSQKTDALFKPPAEPPPHRSVDYRIHLLPKTGLINVEPYRCPQIQEEAMAQVVAKMLMRGIIRPSRSPFSSPVLWVHKKGGSYRSYVDYRILMVVTVRDHVPIPTIDELLDDLRQAQVFTTLDLYSSYHQIRVQSSDIHKTSFRSSDDHYEFLACHVLKTLKQLRAFLWFIGYYRRIVSNYASIAAPLTDLLHKDSFSWSPQAQLSFEALKKAISTALVLRLPDFALEFIVKTLASNVGTGAVLMHSDQPIAFHIKFWVQWWREPPKNATWEDWDNLCAPYPTLHLEDKVIVEGGRNVTTSILLLGLQIHPRKWMKKAQCKSHLC